MPNTALTLQLKFDQDTILAPQQARQLAKQLGFDKSDQTRIATAVSELARIALQYGQGGTFAFSLTQELPQYFVIELRDLPLALSSLQQSLLSASTDITRGLAAVQRLMDYFQLQPTSTTGTLLRTGKCLPKRAAFLTETEFDQIVEALLQETPTSPLEEIRRQNQDLLQTLEQLRQREEQLLQLNRELEETNRGVVALYAELDEKAISLKRANELKTRFFSYTSHEFRTPLNAITSLSQLLLEHLDGPLTPEQEKQVSLIQRAAEGLTEQINDLLDLAKAESGKLTIYPTQFAVSSLFGTLRGLMRPLLTPDITLTFDDGPLPLLYTDEGKLAQILRNFISNALKYTRQGEVRVTATLSGPQAITFAVSDTGIGIAPEDQAWIFEDFTQVDSPLQHRTKGTGLGLPLSRKLADLLGGTLCVTSALGVGSTFSITLPLQAPPIAPPLAHSDRSETVPSPSPKGGSNPDPNAEDAEPIAAQVSTPAVQPPTESPDSTQRSQSDPLPTLLLIDDDPNARYILRKQLTALPLRILEAASGPVGLQLAEAEHPQAIILDLIMPEVSGLEVLEQLKQNPTTRDIPIIVSTSKILSPEEYQKLSPLVVKILSKDRQAQWGSLVNMSMKNVLARAGLVIAENREDSPDA
jgi:signal transduction histidine kinase/CheY-like chemotaxis protein